MKDFDEQLFWATIPELNAKLKARDVSALEMARAFGERLEQLGPRYNALALPLTGMRFAKPRTWTKDIKRGRLRGPLQGIPYGVKDLLSVANQLTTWGAKPYAGQVFDYNATVVEQTRRRRRGAHRQTLDGGTGGRRRLPLCIGIAVRSGV